jgi:membrane-associated phospholipid phosphatase
LVAIAARHTKARPIPATRRTEALRELGIFVIAYLIYFGVRSITEGTTAAAMQNAMDLVRLERQLGIAWERPVQDAVLGSRVLLDAANAVYIYGHWPVIIVTGVLLFRHHRHHYYRLRNACLLSGLVGLVIFTLFPVAPPRLTDLPLVDTVTQQAEGYRQIVPRGLVNQYAAMPSFHAGWNVLLGIVVFRATRNLLLRLLAVVGPTAMVLAVVATANHFVVDVVAGIAIACAGLLVMSARERARRRRTLVGAHEHQPARAVSRRPSSRQRSRAPACGGTAARPARRS